MIVMIMNNEAQDCNRPVGLRHGRLMIMMNNELEWLIGNRWYYLLECTVFWGLGKIK